MGLEILTLGSSKTYTNLVALGLSSAVVDDTAKTITFTLAADGSQHTIHFDQPKDGVSITNISVDANNNLVCTMSDGTEQKAKINILDNVYTKTETDTLLLDKAEKNHNHDSAYASKDTEHEHTNKETLDKFGVNDGGKLTFNGDVVTPEASDLSDYLKKTEAQNIYVAKETGKGLSENDFTTVLKDAYDKAVEDSHTHTNKSVIDKFSESADGALLYDGKSIEADLSTVYKKTETYSQTEADNKFVAKETGKDLSSNDYTTEEKDKLASLDNYDDTQVKTQIQAVANGLMDSVGYSADYKTIDIIAKNGVKKSVNVAPIISHASITELSDVDTTNKATGKALVYNATTSKHEYADVSGTDEKVKMDASTDAKYLGELLDNITIANENGKLKVKKLDGQEVTITEINYLKGLTMNVMDLVNMFSNGGVKIINTPVATYAELLTIDKSSFIEGISYLVYVLADENHENAKTTYLVDKDSETPTYFGFADSQRDFTTNPIDLATEITGKLGIANMDSDAIKALFTVDDTYKTETTTNNAFSTHGAKALYDELLLAIGNKANDSDLTAHKDDTDIHVSTEDRTKWDSAKTHADSAHAPSNAQENVLETVKVNGTALEVSNKAVNVTVPTKVSELTDSADYAKTADVNNSISTLQTGKADASDLTAHTDDADIHVTADNKTLWNTVEDKVDKTSIATALDDTVTDEQVTSALLAKTELDKKVDKTSIATELSDASTDDEVVGALTAYNELQKLESANKEQFATVSGDYITVTDSVDGKLVELGVKGNSFQNTYIGKNLIAFPYYDTAKTVNGITFTVNSSDGSVTANGTATSNAIFFFRYREDNPLTAGNYVLSGTPKGGSKTTYYQWFGIWDGTANVYGVYDVGDSANITLTDELCSQSLVIGCYVYSGATVSNLTFYPQLELGETATEFEPYVGGVPSPNPSYPQEINSVGDDGSLVVKSCGKNIIPFPYFNSSDIRVGVTATVNVDSSIILKGTATSNYFFVLLHRNANGKGFAKKLRGKTVTISGGTSRPVLSFAVYDEDGNNVTPPNNEMLYDYGGGVTVTIPDNACDMYSYYYFSSGNTVDVTLRPQLEVSDVVTVYEPYKSSTTTIPLSEPLHAIGDIKDEITYQDGKWGVLRRTGEYVVDGTESWVLDSEHIVDCGISARLGSYANILKGISIVTNNTKDMITDYLRCRELDHIPYYAASNGVQEDKGSGTYRTSGNIWISFGASDIEKMGITKDIDSVKAWLSSHNITFIYPLGTPTFEPFADQSLPYLSTYDGVTNISNDDALSAEMTVKYPTTDASGVGSRNESRIAELAKDTDDVNKSLDTLEFGEVAGGKNLFEDEIKWMENITVTRGTKSVSDGKITLTATSADCYTDHDGASWKNNGIKTIPCKPNKKYTFSWEYEGDSIGDVYIFENGSTNNMSYTINKSHKLLITTSADAEYLTVRVGVRDSGTSITYWNFQLEEGDTATPYETYIPSIKMLEDEVKQQNKSLGALGKCKNLLKPVFVSGWGCNCVIGDDGKITLTSTNTEDYQVVIGYIHKCSLKANKTYYFRAFDIINIDHIGIGKVGSDDLLKSFYNQLIYTPTEDMDIQLLIYFSDKTVGTISSCYISVSEVYTDEYVPYTGDGETLTHDVAELKNDLSVKKFELVAGALWLCVSGKHCVLTLNGYNLTESTHFDKLEEYQPYLVARNVVSKGDSVCIAAVEPNGNINASDLVVGTQLTGQLFGEISWIANI